MDVVLYVSFYKYRSMRLWYLPFRGSYGWLVLQRLVIFIALKTHKYDERELIGPTAVKKAREDV